MSPLSDPKMLALKAAVSSALAWALVHLLHNPDGVSAAFVAVICTSPTVLSGVKRARDQALGSIVGGLAAALVALLGLPQPLGLGLAVGGAVGLTLAVGLGAGYLVAAFTAVYMVLLPQTGGPLQTLEVRMVAVALGAVAAMAVNGAVSILAYRSIFRRRVALARSLVADRLQALGRAERPPRDALLDVFPVLGGLATELRDAQDELRWRSRSPLAREIGRQVRLIEAVHRLTHLTRDLALLRQGTTWRPGEADLLLAIAARLRGQDTPLPEPPPPDGQRLAACAAAILTGGSTEW